MPHLPCPAWQLAISSSHLIVLWLWPCSLKQRTQFNSRLINVTAPPALLACPSPVPHLSQLCPTCLTCLTTPSCLTCSEFPLHYFQDYRKTLNEFQPEHNAFSASSALLPPALPLPLLLRLYLTLLTGGRTASFYLHTFGINWSSLFRVSFLTPFPSPSFPPRSGTTHT